MPFFLFKGELSYCLGSAVLLIGWLWEAPYREYRGFGKETPLPISLPSPPP